MADPKASSCGRCWRGGLQRWLVPFLIAMFAAVVGSVSFLITNQTERQQELKGLSARGICLEAAAAATEQLAIALNFEATFSTGFNVVDSCGANSVATSIPVEFKEFDTPVERSFIAFFNRTCSDPNLFAATALGNYTRALATLATVDLSRNLTDDALARLTRVAKSTCAGLNDDAVATRLTGEIAGTVAAFRVATGIPFSNPSFAAAGVFHTTVIAQLQRLLLTQDGGTGSAAVSVTLIDMLDALVTVRNIMHAVAMYNAVVEAATYYILEGRIQVLRFHALVITGSSIARWSRPEAMQALQRMDAVLTTSETALAMSYALQAPLTAVLPVTPQALYDTWTEMEHATRTIRAATHASILREARDHEADGDRMLLATGILAVVLIGALVSAVVTLCWAHAHDSIGRAHEDAKRRRNFVRYVLHEARVPLSSISIGIDLLAGEIQEEEEEEEQHNLLASDDAGQGTLSAGGSPVPVSPGSLTGGGGGGGGSSSMIATAVTVPTAPAAVSASGGSITGDPTNKSIIGGNGVAAPASASGGGDAGAGTGAGVVAPVAVRSYVHGSLPQSPRSTVAHGLPPAAPSAMAATNAFALAAARRRHRRERAELLHLMRQGCDNMKGMLDGVLDLEKIEADSLTLQVADICLHDELAAVVAMMRPSAASRGIMIHMANGELAPAAATDAHVPKAALPGLHVVADGIRLKQVIANLISNSSKFSTTGSHITLRLSAEQLPASVQTVAQLQDAVARALRASKSFYTQHLLSGDSSNAAGAASTATDGAGDAPAAPAHTCRVSEAVTNCDAWSAAWTRWAGQAGALQLPTPDSHPTLHLCATGGDSARRCIASTVHTPHCAAPASGQAQEWSPHLVKLVVVDQGAGMGPEEVDKLFTPFYQTKSGRSSAIAGSGLGLLIVRMLVRLHGGDMSIASQPGRGTAMTICFPTVARAQQTPLSIRASSRASAGSSVVARSPQPVVPARTGAMSPAASVAPADVRIQIGVAGPAGALAVPVVGDAVSPVPGTAASVRAAPVDAEVQPEYLSKLLLRAGVKPHSASSFNLLAGTASAPSTSSSRSTAALVPLAAPASAAVPVTTAATLSGAGLALPLGAGAAGVLQTPPAPLQVETAPSSGLTTVVSVSSIDDKLTPTPTPKKLFIVERTNAGSSASDPTQVTPATTSGLSSPAMTAADAPAPHTPCSFVTPKPLAHKRVLVVDDDSSNAMMMARLLRRLGATEVDTAGNGAQALDMVFGSATAAATLPPNAYSLIACDRNMPVLDGVAAARALRERGYAGVILGITGDAMAKETEEFLAAGINAVVHKPVTQAALLGKLHDVGFNRW